MQPHYKITLFRLHSFFLSYTYKLRKYLVAAFTKGITNCTAITINVNGMQGMWKLASNHKDSHDGYGTTGLDYNTTGRFISRQLRSGIYEILSDLMKGNWVGMVFLHPFLIHIWPWGPIFHRRFSTTFPGCPTAIGLSSHYLSSLRS